MRLAPQESPRAVAVIDVRRGELQLAPLQRLRGSVAQVQLEVEHRPAQAEEPRRLVPARDEARVAGGIAAVAGAQLRDQSQHPALVLLDRRLAAARLALVSSHL